MRAKEAFKQKMEAEVARAQADLERYTAGDGVHWCS